MPHLTCDKNFINFHQIEISLFQSNRKTIRYRPKFRIGKLTKNVCEFVLGNFRVLGIEVVIFSK